MRSQKAETQDIMAGAGSADTSVRIWQPGISDRSTEDSEHAGYGVVHTAHLEVQLLTRGFLFLE